MPSEVSGELWSDDCGVVLRGVSRVVCYGVAWRGAEWYAILWCGMRSKPFKNLRSHLKYCWLTTAQQLLVLVSQRLCDADEKGGMLDERAVCHLAECCSSQEYRVIS